VVLENLVHANTKGTSETVNATFELMKNAVNFSRVAKSFLWY